MSKEQLRENKKILYERHNYNPKDQTKNVHHIVMKSENGGDQLENLALLDKDFHDWIHEFLEKIHI
jgi:hypothetical protein